MTIANICQVHRGEEHLQMEGLGRHEELNLCSYSCAYIFLCKFPSYSLVLKLCHLCEKFSTESSFLPGTDSVFSVFKFLLLKHIVWFGKFGDFKICLLFMCYCGCCFVVVCFVLDQTQIETWPLTVLTSSFFSTAPSAIDRSSTKPQEESWKGCWDLLWDL